YREIGEFDPTVVREEYVPGFHGTVGDVVGVCGCQRGGELHTEVGGVFRGEITVFVQELVHGAGRHVLHELPDVSAVGDGVVDRDGTTVHHPACAAPLT